MLKVCLDCATRYLPGVPKCPQCGGMSWRPDYEEEDMPKVTVGGGPSNAAETPPATETAPAPEVTEEAPKAKAAPKAKGGTVSRSDAPKVKGN